MAVSPLDLQTMYSQIDNVARQANYLQQGIKNAETIQQENALKQNLENAQKVQSSAEGAKSGSVNQDGSNANGGQKRFYKNPQKEEQENKDEEHHYPKERNLGNFVDIMR